MARRAARRAVIHPVVGQRQQKPVFRRDLCRNLLSIDPIALAAQPGDAGRIHGERSVHPPLKSAQFAGFQIVATGQHGDPGSGRNCLLQHQVGQGPAGMGGNHQVAGLQRRGGEIRFGKVDPALQPGPLFEQGGRQGGSALGNTPVNGQKLWRAVIEEQEDLPQQAVTTGQVDDPPAPEAASHPAGDFPGLEQLFARQTAGPADRPGNGLEQGGSGKLREETFVEAITGRVLQNGRQPILVAASATVW